MEAALIMTPPFYTTYAKEITDAITQIDPGDVEVLVDSLARVRSQQGRVAILGIGGSAGNASHMVNDLRKLCGIDAYCPTDNVPELTARTNDEGFETIFVEWLKTSRWTATDAIFVLSVGGGCEQPPVSLNLVRAIQYAKQLGAMVLGIVGKPQGYAALHGDAVLVVPQTNPERVTPYSEAIQAVIWHALVSHPHLQRTATKW